jgi:GDP-4-dehydro-6-deoxy-D-mannose reductase
VVDAYTEALLLFDGLPNGAAINIASGEARAIQEVLEILVALSRVKIDAVLLRPSDTPVVLGSADRARDWLRWSPK